jgi:hypothetical protein
MHVRESAGAFGPRPDSRPFPLFSDNATGADRRGELGVIVILSGRQNRRPDSKVRR